MDNQVKQNLDAEHGLEDSALKSLKFFQTYQQPIIGSLLFIVAVVLLIAYRSREDAEQRATAWTALFDAEKREQEASKPSKDKPDPKNPEPKKDDGVDFTDVAKKYSRTAVEPFALIRQAGKLYEKGSKEDLTKSKELLELVLRRFPEMSIYADLAHEKIKAIDAELGHAPSWLPKKEEKKDDEKKDGEKKGTDDEDGDHEGHGHK